MKPSPIRTFLTRTIIAVVVLAVAFFIFISSNGSDEDAPDWLQLSLGLFGGLALFLAGLQELSEGMKKAAGETLKTVLGKLTTNRFKGAITGAFVTGVLNSSTVTTLLVVSFISGGMMTLSQSVGVIMGANIGSTVTAQLLAFDLSAYSLGPVAIGFFMLYTAKQERIKYYGMMIMGIGLVFYGMGLMGDAMTPLRSYPPFLKMLEGLEKPIAGIIAGAAFTAIVQSSAATVGIAIAMAAEGLLALPAGIALALGANIGTAVTTAFMGILSSKSTEAVRASVVHVAFNVLGTLLWLPFVGQLVEVAAWISPSSPELQGAARVAADVPRQIANANTFFNVANTLLFIGFTGWFARLAEWLVPDRPPAPGAAVEPEFLDEAALADPSIALQDVRLELGRVGAITLEMLTDIGPVLQRMDMSGLKVIVQRYAEVETLEAEILNYLAKIRRGLITERQSLELQHLMTITDILESLASVIENDLVSLAEKAADIKNRTGEETGEILQALYESVVESVELAVTAVRDCDQEAASAVLRMKNAIHDHTQQVLARKAKRLTVDDPDYLNLVRLEMAFVEQMRRIYSLAKRVAKVTLPPAVAEHR